MKLDEAVVKLLKLEPELTSLSAGGIGSSSASTNKIATKDENGKERNFFMKTGTGKDAEIMFQGHFNYEFFRRLLMTPQANTCR
jgi:hypothetical protein